MNLNKGTSSIAIIVGIIIIALVGAVFAWQYFSGVGKAPKEAVNTFMKDRVESNSEVSSYLPDSAETNDLKIATVLTTFSKIILTAPDLKKYEVMEAKKIGSEEFQFKVKPYLVKNGKELGYFEETIVMEKSNNDYIVNSFEQSGYKSLTGEDPCKGLSTEPVTHGEYQFPSERDFCYWSLAEETKNLDLCDKIEDDLSKSECYAELAIVKENQDICEEFKDDLWFRTKCYTGIAKKTQDKSVCNEIEDEKSREGCVAEVEGEKEKKEKAKTLEEKIKTIKEKLGGRKIEPATISDWETYQNREYGYKLQYPEDFEEMTGGKEVSFSLPLEEGTVYSRVGEQPAVLLGGTYGGWYSFEKSAEDSNLTNRLLSYEVTLEDKTFQVGHWAAYGGMGGWDTVVNVFTEHDDKYYTLSLVHSFVSGSPGMATAEGGKTTAEELKIRALEKMSDKSNKYVEIFDQMLSTFDFVEKEAWKTYENDQFGYSIEYPQDWKGAGLFGGHEDMGMVFGKDFSKNNAQYSCELSIVHNGSKERVTSKISEGWQESEVQIGGTTTTKASDPEFPFQSYYYLEAGENSYEIHQQIIKKVGGMASEYTSVPEIESECKNVFDQMISSIAF